MPQLFQTSRSNNNNKIIKNSHPEFDTEEPILIDEWKDLGGIPW